MGLFLKAVTTDIHYAFTNEPNKTTQTELNRIEILALREKSLSSFLENSYVKEKKNKIFLKHLCFLKTNINDE